MHPLKNRSLPPCLLALSFALALRAETPVVNPDGYLYVPSLTGSLGYVPGGDEPTRANRSLTRATGYTDSLQAREPLSSACSLIGDIRSSSPSKTRVDPALTNGKREPIDEEISNLNWDIGITLYTGGTGEPEAPVWGVNSTARGYYYWPKIDVEVTDDTLLTSDTAANVLDWSNTSQTDDAYISVGAALPKYLFLSFTFEDVFAGTNTYNRIGSVILILAHTNEALDDAFIDATEMAALRIPLAPMATAFIQYQVLYPLAMTDKLIATTQTLSAGLVFFPGALLNP
jgi:hypothetical protein